MKEVKFEVVSMCRGAKCCPEAVFYEDGRVALRENGQEIVMSKDTFDLLLEEAARRRQK